MEAVEEAITGGVDLPLRIPTGEDTKNTREEEVTAATEVVLLSLRRIGSTVLAIVTKRGRKNTEEVILRTLEDDGNRNILKLIES